MRCKAFASDPQRQRNDAHGLLKGRINRHASKCTRVRGSIAAVRHIKTVAETSRQCQIPALERGKLAPSQIGARTKRMSPRAGACPLGSGFALNNTSLGGYAMNQVSSGKASKPNKRQGLRHLLWDRHVRMGAAILLLAGGFHVTSGAFAQAQDTASCVEKCKADQKQCLNDGSSEELCEYDSKACQKACSETK
jgi:hypothetical protein